MNRRARQWQAEVDRRTQEVLRDEAVGTTAPCDRARLDLAYRDAARTTLRYYPSIYLGLRLMPRAQRRAMYAVAAFLRKSDVLSEREGPEARQAWRRWCAATLADTPPPDDDVLLAFADARVRFAIPRAWVAEELAGLSQDHAAPHYETMGHLTAYCFGALGAAGLLMLRIMGVRDREAETLAVRFAVATQLSDMLGDIGEDFDKGRCYLPRAELEALGIRLDDVRSRGTSPAWRRFMIDLVTCNRQLFVGAAPGIERLPVAAAIGTAVIGALREAQLDDIESADYDVFRHPPRFRLGHLAAAARAALGVAAARVRGRVADQGGAASAKPRLP